MSRVPVESPGRMAPAARSGARERAARPARRVRRRSLRPGFASATCLIAAGSLEKGDVFFLQAPELIEAARNLPAPLPPDLVSKVKNRRRGYLVEARLIGSDAEPALSEDDYY